MHLRKKDSRSCEHLSPWHRQASKNCTALGKRIHKLMHNLQIYTHIHIYALRHVREATYVQLQDAFLYRFQHHTKSDQGRSAIAIQLWHLYPIAMVVITPIIMPAITQDSQSGVSRCTLLTSKKLPPANPLGPQPSPRLFPQSPKQPPLPVLCIPLPPAPVPVYVTM